MKLQLLEVKELSRSVQECKTKLDNIQREIQERSKPSFKESNNRVWVPKTLVLMSINPFFDYLRDLLKDLVNRFRSYNGFDDVLEAYVYKLVFEIPTP